MTEQGPGSPARSVDLAPMEPATAAWTWMFADAAGVAAPGPTLSFASQEGAESWLSEHFEELDEMGIATVSLLDGERAVYGPMYLAPEAAGPDEAPAEL